MYISGIKEESRPA